MESERWQRIQALFAAASERPPEERDAFLREKSGKDEELYREVASLLESSAHAESFVEGAVQGGYELYDPSASEDTTTRRIGKYEILDKIGQGGFGTVYKGRDPLLQRTVAVKTCTADHEELRRRFVREGRIAANLQHPNVTTIHDFGLEGEVPYLVQEFLPGRDLSEPGEEALLDTEAKIKILLGIARGLEYAHSQGVLHRDIKPSNIRVLENGMVKIMDFGIARLLSGADAPLRAVGNTRLTGTGMTIGTVGYLAPEQLKAEEVDPRTDMFSFGVLAYELFAGIRPFQGETFSQVSYQLLYEEPVPLDEAWPGCPDRRIAHLVSRCLEKDADRRHDSMSEVVRELEAVLAGGRSTTDGLAPGRDAPSKGVADQKVSGEAVPREAAPEEIAACDPTQEMPRAPSSGPSDAAIWLDVPGSQELTRLEILPVPEPTLVEATPRPALWRRSGVVTAFVSMIAIGSVWAIVKGRGDREGVREAAPPPAPPPVEAARALEDEQSPVPAAAPTTPSIKEEEKRADEERASLGEIERVPPSVVQDPEPAETPQNAPSGPTSIPSITSPAPAVEEEVAVTSPPSSAPPPPSPVPPPPSPVPPPPSPVPPPSSTPSLHPEKSPPPSSTPSLHPEKSPPPSSTPPPDVEPLPEGTPPAAPTSFQPMKPGDYINKDDPGVIVPPQILHAVQPKYPRRASRLGQTARVVIGAFVDEQGKVIRTMFLQEDGSGLGFNEAALQAAKKTRFRPATRDGIPGKMWTEIPYDFSLNR